MEVVFFNFATKLTTECAKLGHRFKINTKKHEFTPYTTTAFQTSDVSFLGKTYMHSAGRTTGNGEPESLSLG